MNIPKIRVSLADEKIWKQFQPATEMVASKTGRLIFPQLKYRIDGLDVDKIYQIYVFIERIDDRKYVYTDGVWEPLKKVKPPLPIVLHEHLDKARPGAHWMNHIVSFAELKITNNEKNMNGHVAVVQSQHKFRPVVVVKEIGQAIGEAFRHKLTEFMAVTKYKSREMVKLKTEHNNFAHNARAKRLREESEASSSLSSPAIRDHPHFQSDSTEYPESSPDRSHDQDSMSTSLDLSYQQDDLATSPNSNSPSPAPVQSLSQVQIPSMISNSTPNYFHRQQNQGSGSTSTGFPVIAPALTLYGNNPQYFCLPTPVPVLNRGQNFLGAPVMPKSMPNHPGSTARNQNFNLYTPAPLQQQHYYSYPNYTVNQYQFNYQQNYLQPVPRPQSMPPVAPPVTPPYGIYPQYSF